MHLWVCGCVDFGTLYMSLGEESGQPLGFLVAARSSTLGAVVVVVDFVHSRVLVFWWTTSSSVVSLVFYVIGIDWMDLGPEYIIIGMLEQEAITEPHL